MILLNLPNIPVTEHTSYNAEMHYLGKNSEGKFGEIIETIPMMADELDFERKVKKFIKVHKSTFEMTINCSYWSAEVNTSNVIAKRTYSYEIINNKAKFI